MLACAGTPGFLMAALTLQIRSLLFKHFVYFQVLTFGNHLIKLLMVKQIPSYRSGRVLLEQ